MMKIRKFMVFLLVFSMVCSMFMPVGSHAQDVPAKAVPEGYIGIYDIADLYGIRNDLSANYILMNDIDMSIDTAEGGDWNLLGHGWTPIDGFAGTLDGNGHRIIGMHIYGEMGQDVGLFGTTSGSAYNPAIIKNLAMVDMDIDINLNYSYSVGGIIGENNGGIDVEKCYTSGNVTVTCTPGADGCIVGGLVGKHYGTMANVYNTCNITVIGANRVGGISGHSSCNSGYNVGLISHTDTTTVTEEKTYPIAGYDIGGVSNCYYLSGTANTNNTGCTSLFATQLKDKRTLIGFDFDNIWEIDPYCDYPYPQLKCNRQIRIVSVDIVNEPDKIEYEQGDSIDTSGGTIKITYEDETTATIPITEDMVSGFDMNLVAEQNVTVTYCGVSTTYPITVKEVPLTGIALNQSKASLVRNKTLQLSVLYTPSNASDKSIQWTSSNSTVAKVDSNGLVTAKNKGTATITATSSNGLAAQCEVNVLIPCATITLNKDSANMKVGDSMTLTAQMLPLDTTDVLEWKTSNASVADVSNGMITAYSAGTAKITAYVEGGVTATCKIRVKNSSSSSGKQNTSKNANASTITLVKGKITSIKNIKKKSIKLKLSNFGSADGYQIQYSLNKNFKNSKKIKKKSTSITIKKLKKKRKYYVRARVYGKVNGKTYYGKWSSKKSVKIKK